MSANRPAAPSAEADSLPPRADRAWWRHAPFWAAEADRQSSAAPGAAHRFGDVVLAVDSTYQPLLDDLASVYAECTAAATEPGARLRCSARFLEAPRLVALRFDGPVVPDLLDAALSLVQ